MLTFFQKQAAHKLKGAIKLHGLDISIEHPKGSAREWKNPDGTSGKTIMGADYGYIRKTKGVDGDHVDVYVGPNHDSTKVFVISQMKRPAGSVRGDGKQWKSFDEQKVMLGFDSAEAAKSTYLNHYDDPRFFGKMHEMPLDTFKERVLSKANHGKRILGGVRVATQALRKKKAAMLISNPDSPLHTPPGYRKNKQAKPKTASLTERQERIANRINDAGIGLLAAPYVVIGLSRLKSRGGVLGAIGRGAAAVETPMYRHELPMELTGLALIAPGVTNRLAKGIDSMTTKPPPPAGRTLAKVAASLMEDSQTKEAFVADPAAAVSDAAIGGLVGTATGHLTGRVLGKYPGQSRDYGAKGGAIVGTLSHLAGGGNSKAVRIYKDLGNAMALPKGLRGGEVARALGRGALSYAPEAAGGALGAAIFARKQPSGQQRRSVKLLAKGQDRKAMRAASTVADGSIKQSALDVGVEALESGASLDGVSGAIVAGEKLAGIVGALGRSMWKYKKPLATVGAIGGVGAMAYGGKKAIDFAANKAQHGDHRQPRPLRRQTGMGHGIIGK